MRSCKMFLAITVSLIGLTAAASAEEWTKSLTTGFYNGYMFRQTGSVLWDSPVNQSNIDFTNGPWTLEIFSYTALAAPGPYGNRGAGDEHDFGAFYSPEQVDTFLGPIAFRGSVSYWMLADFGRMKDDLAVLTAEAGRPFALGSATATVYARGVEWVSVGNLPHTSFVELGTRFEIPLDETWRVNIDLTDSIDVTNNVSIKNAAAVFSHDVRPGWTLFVSAQVADRMQPGLGAGVTISGDALGKLF